MQRCHCRCQRLANNGLANIGAALPLAPLVVLRSPAPSFTTFTGTVSAADDWDTPVQHKAVRKAMPGSYGGCAAGLLAGMRGCSMRRRCHPLPEPCRRAKAWPATPSWFWRRHMSRLLKRQRPPCPPASPPAASPKQSTCSTRRQAGTCPSLPWTCGAAPRTCAWRCRVRLSRLRHAAAGAAQAMPAWPWRRAAAERAAAGCCAESVSCTAPMKSSSASTQPKHAAPHPAPTPLPRRRPPAGARHRRHLPPPH